MDKYVDVRELTTYMDSKGHIRDVSWMNVQGEVQINPQHYQGQVILAKSRGNRQKFKDRENVWRLKCSRAAKRSLKGSTWLLGKFAKTWGQEKSLNLDFKQSACWEVIQFSFNF